MKPLTFALDLPEDDESARQYYEEIVDRADLGFDPYTTGAEDSRKLDALRFHATHLRTGLASVSPARRAVR